MEIAKFIIGVLILILVLIAGYKGQVLKKRLDYSPHGLAVTSQLILMWFIIFLISLQVLLYAI